MLYLQLVNNRMGLLSHSQNYMFMFPYPLIRCYSYYVYILKSSHALAHELNKEAGSRKSLWVPFLVGYRKTFHPNRFDIDNILSISFLQSGRPVYLIFSVQGSGHFQGVAKMVSPITRTKIPEFPNTGMSAVFSVDWLKR